MYSLDAATAAGNCRPKLLTPFVTRMRTMASTLAAASARLFDKGRATLHELTSDTIGENLTAEVES